MKFSKLEGRIWLYKSADFGFSSHMEIGNAHFRSNLFLAPLAGYTDGAFRHMATEYGAGCCVTEMVSAEGLARGNDRTADLLKRFDGERELVMQLFGPDVDPFERCLDKVLPYDPTMIDINCGCPVPKVVKTGAGSAMMLSPEKIGRIVSFLSSHTDIPISVKFRLGWDMNSINYLEFAHICADSGAKMLTLHARTRSQGYSGTADWSRIRALKDEFRKSDVKIFGSGDIFKAEDAVRMLDETGCDGVMFARGAIGNPFIFSQVKSLQEKGSYERPSVDEIRSAIMRHYDYMCSIFDERTAGHEMRKHVCAYVKGIPGSSRVKAEIVKAVTRDEYICALGELK